MKVLQGPLMVPIVIALILSTPIITVKTSAEEWDPWTRGSGYGWINGTVTDGLSKRPINRCFVEVLGTTINTYSDANGSYSLQVSPGSGYQVRGMRTGYDNRTVTSGAVAASRMTRLDIALLKNYATLRISFKGFGMVGGSSASNVVVEDHADPSKFRKEYDMPNYITHWEIDVPAPGMYDILGKVPEQGEGTIEETVSVGRGESKVVLLDIADLQPQAGTIIIITMMDNGTALPDVEIRMVYRPVQGTPSEYGRRTNVMGRYTHDGQPGRYNISVSIEGYVEQEVIVNLSGKETLYVNFTLTRDARNVQEGTTLIIVILMVVGVLAVMMVVSGMVLFFIWRRERSKIALGEDEYVCPECGTVVDDKAISCPKCAFKFPWKQFRCPECGQLLEFNARRCGTCGNTEFEMR